MTFPHSNLTERSYEWVRNAYLDAAEEHDRAIGDIDRLVRAIFQQHQDGHRGPFGTCQIGACMAAKQIRGRYGLAPA